MRKLLLTSSICLATLFAIAQKKNTKQESPVKESAADSVFFSKIKYREVGPFRGGRSGAVAGSYKNKNTFYFGATGGGVWKTTDGGNNWKNISDKYFGGSIGSVAVAPSDETVLYVGEGESTLRGNVSEGLGGMWRSDDGGRSWKNIGLKDTRHIVKIVIHPKDPNTVWVAVMGHMFGPNEDRGVYKTTDGGKTWKKVLYVNSQTGCSDITMEPNNPSILYAGLWHVIRTPYSMESGGDGSGLWKSTDGGDTWINLSNKKGLSKGVWGIVTVAVAASNTDKIYTVIENAKGGLFASEDGGETWTLQSNDNNIRQRAWYYSRVFVDPKNEHIVYCPNVNFMRSKDGGKTFQAVNSTPHGDHHDLWIDPEDGNRMIVADDGGAQVSFDGAANFSNYYNQPTAQFYRVTTDNAFPYRILGAQQDNSTVRIKSRTYGNAITQDDWQPTAGAESGYVVADPLNPDIVYGGNYGGFLSRLDHKTGENRAINVWPDNPMGAGADVQKYRFQWNFPIFFSPHNPKRLYACGDHLFVTENEGQSWEMISPDLTTNDKTKQVSSGGPITKDNTSVEYYCTIFTATESPLEKDLLYTGSDDGILSVSKDGGKHWDNVTPKNCPKWMMWNTIETDPFKKGAAYIVGTRYKLDDYTPYIYKTEDYGQSWKLITAGIDPMHFTRVLRADKKRPGLLYAGTEFGMYISYDDGANWKKFQLNLPIVPITDLTIKENDLIVATQGRAFWMIDDLSLLQQKDNTVTNRKLHVFTVNDSYRMEGGGSSRRRGVALPHNAGMNPPNGVVFNYWLKDATDTSKVSISIYDKKGMRIKTFSKDAKEEYNKLEFTAGMNQFVWDMLYPPAEKLDGLILWNGNVEGPKVAPGTYTASVYYDGDSVKVPFTIKGDPNYAMTEADYDAQTGMLLQIRDKFSEVQKAIKTIRAVRSQITDFTAKMDTVANKAVKLMADSISKQITTIEEALYQTKSKSGQDVLNFPIRLNDKISGLYDVAASGYNPPSKQVKEAFADLSAQADVQLTKLKKIMGEALPALNTLIHNQQVPVISIKD
ncbi:hypothetical protein ACFOW1_14685 [Parasediminibacterium paludis]|uniref:Sortilin N-terminal domain-containing protein n=1 Tax=Parasediminibacterium paludis TaxID=908966 RepID=A0ABV8Q0U7_9BACT